MNWKERAYIDLQEIIELENHKVRVYENRLAVWRKDGERLTWEELQKVKEQVWGDEIAVEVYPAKCDVVNLRHTRHLWKSPEIEAAIKISCNHPEFGAKNDK